MAGVVVTHVLRITDETVLSCHLQTSIVWSRSFSSLLVTIGSNSTPVISNPETVDSGEHIVPFLSESQRISKVLMFDVHSYHFI